MVRFGIRRQTKSFTSRPLGHGASGAIFCLLSSPRACSLRIKDCPIYSTFVLDNVYEIDDNDNR